MVFEVDYRQGDGFECDASSLAADQSAAGCVRASQRNLRPAITDGLSAP